MKRALIILSGIISVIYILNPTAGFLELIPDNIPGIGNLDEGMATYVIISVIAYLQGKDFGLFGVKKEGEQLLESTEEKEDKSD